jgi:23S rRNA (cytidine1920-2'-O)/16S rRNA (cytidine1409-2'-O)-methyltransferase
MARVRLDQLVVARGLAPSRERARALILAGHVKADGVDITKAGHLVEDTAALTLRQSDHRWASRGGLKLVHALEVFGIDVTDRVALDVGASTGGFTDVLLDHGAARVVALDVGRGQLDWRLRRDARVVCVEGVNARHLTAADLPDGLRRFDVITVDVAFISLRHIFPALPDLLARDGRVIALVKPQFEAGREEVGKGGIVRDAAVHARVVDEAAEAAHQVGLSRIDATPSPIEGAEGNREFFLLLGAAEGT